jgi:caffeoyl-CoA O-methyltransferase
MSNFEFIDSAVEAYAEAHTTPAPPWLSALAEETRRDFTAHGMMVGPLEGRFLEMLVFCLRPQRVLEIGTFTGYSSVSMAAALPAGGRIVTCDVDSVSNAVARRVAAAAGVEDRIDFRLGPALETIAGLDGPFEFVFIDADKPNYVNYYEAVLPKLSDGGLIAADNTLWSGRVVDESADDDNTVAIRSFNDHVARDERVVCVQLTVRDGVTLIRKAV